MKELNINGYKEQIIERSDYPIEKCKRILNDKITAILGYGPQGRGQSLNMRDQGFNVIVGLRKGSSWDKAIKDGWIEGKDLFEINEATKKGDIIQFLLSDAGQIQAWPKVKENLSEGNTLYFSHGFGVLFFILILILYLLITLMLFWLPQKEVGSLFAIIFWKVEE